MSIPVWVLLGFAGWTLVTLFGSVGVYRWSRILTGRAKITEFVAGVPHGPEWYQRAMRAHANCVENLPVYGAVVVAIVASGTRSPLLDGLAIVLLLARMGQTIVHVVFEPTSAIVGVRFSFFSDPSGLHALDGGLRRVACGVRGSLEASDSSSGRRPQCRWRVRAGRAVRTGAAQPRRVGRHLAKRLPAGLSLIEQS